MQRHPVQRVDKVATLSPAALLRLGDPDDLYALLLYRPPRMSPGDIFAYEIILFVQETVFACGRVLQQHSSNFGFLLPNESSVGIIFTFLAEFVYRLTGCSGTSCFQAME